MEEKESQEEKEIKSEIEEDNDMARIWVPGHYKYVVKNGRRRRVWVKGYWKTVNVRTRRWRW